MNNIKVIAIHDQETEDIFPTAGIFDESLNLNPNVIDVESNNVGGIILVGYISFVGEIDEFTCKVSVLLEYEDEQSNVKQIFYQYQK